MDLSFVHPDSGPNVRVHWRYLSRAAEGSLWLVDYNNTDLWLVDADSVWYLGWSCHFGFGGTGGDLLLQDGTITSYFNWHIINIPPLQTVYAELVEAVLRRQELVGDQGLLHHPAVMCLAEQRGYLQVFTNQNTTLHVTIIHSLTNQYTALLVTRIY